MIDTVPHANVDTIRLDAASLDAFIAKAFPHTSEAIRGRVVQVMPGRVRMEMTPGVEQLRPGSIVSGPTLMAYADTAAYAVVLAHIGEVAMAVTNNLNIHFLRACPLQPLCTEAILIKLGRRIATVDIRIAPKATPDRLVAQASATYVLP